MKSWSSYEGGGIVIFAGHRQPHRTYLPSAYDPPRLRPPLRRGGRNFVAFPPAPGHLPTLPLTTPPPTTIRSPATLWNSGIRTFSLAKQQGKSLVFAKKNVLPITSGSFELNEGPRPSKCLKTMRFPAALRGFWLRSNCPRPSNASESYAFP